MSEAFPNSKVKIVDHPLALAVLTKLRDRRTKQIEFRKGLVKLGRLIGYWITMDFEKKEIEVETPLGVSAKGVYLPEMNRIVIVQILRASMPFVEGLIKVFPNARMGVVSARRVEEKGMTPDKKFDIEIKYVKIPRINSDDILIVADPMFATGSTAVATIDRVLKENGKPKKTILATVISTNIAIKRVLDAFPETLIYTVSIDPELNDKGYIVPGLGDAGDRAFGE